MVATVRDGEIPYQSVTVILAAGETRLISGSLRYLQVRSATDQTKIAISFNGSSFYNIPTGEQLADFEADGVWLQNTDVAPNTVTIVTGMATLNSTRVIIDSSGTLTVQLTGTGAVSSVDLGVKADVVATSDTGTFSLIALFKRLLAKFPSNPKGIRVRGQTASMTGTTPTQVIAAPGAGLHLVIKSVLVYCTHATVQTEVAITDGSGGTELFRVNVKAGSATTGTEGPIVQIPDGLQLTSNTALFAVNITTGSATRVAAFGVIEAD